MFLILFLVALVLVGLVVVYSMRQGRRFIRAATFLRERAAGASVAQANAAADILFTAQSTPGADAFAAQQADAMKRETGTDQTQLIADARRQGFES